ncbi:hypothetical protein GTZ99_13935 [Novosphingobium sp. FSY-8]|uniref:Uncharacterized protein n=1 Tax=Novosphingobium ovatum TaxID=1908523 RepID=A0ABW9XGL8_9SPHN|nr:hypothetical protein [Novosphingobium ovatum]NBC37651.1 hypothetical protein [Novosphingobium ovatum]
MLIVSDPHFLGFLITDKTNGMHRHKIITLEGFDPLKIIMAAKKMIGMPFGFGQFTHDRRTVMRKMMIQNAYLCHYSDPYIFCFDVTPPRRNPLPNYSIRTNSSPTLAHFMDFLPIWIG